MQKKDSRENFSNLLENVIILLEQKKTLSGDSIFKLHTYPNVLTELLLSNFQMLSIIFYLSILFIFNVFRQIPDWLKLKMSVIGPKILISTEYPPHLLNKVSKKDPTKNKSSQTQDLQRRLSSS